MIRNWYRSAVVPRRAIARLLPSAGGGLVAGLLALDVVLGLLPVAFVLATSVVVGQVPAAVDGGTGSAAWGDLVRTFVLAAVLFLARQVLAPVQTALGVRMQRRIDGALSRRRIEPVVLARTEGTWYVVAWCQAREDLRWFRLGRILRADLTPEGYDPRPVADIGTAPPDARPVSSRPSD